MPAQNPAQQNQQNNHKPFYKKNWFIALVVLASLAILASAVINTITIRIKKEALQQENTWNQLTPSHSKLTDVYQQLGQPIEAKQADKKTELFYQSTYPTQHNKVVVDDQEQLVFVKEYLPLEVKEVVGEYYSDWGQPDLINKTTSNAPLEAHIYLDKGVALIAHIKDGSIEQKWYFNPTTKENFLQSWGQDLSSQGAGPERSLR